MNDFTLKSEQEPSSSTSNSTITNGVALNLPSELSQVDQGLIRKRYQGTSLTARQWEVIRYRSQGYTQNDVAKKLETTRENVSIIEHRALRKITTAKATLAALQHMDATNLILIPSGTSIYEATEMIILRADILGVKLRSTCDGMVAALRSKCKGKIRRHHLISVARVEIGGDGYLTINPEA